MILSDGAEPTDQPAFHFIKPEEEEDQIGGTILETALVGGITQQSCHVSNTPIYICSLALANFLGLGR